MKNNREEIIYRALRGKATPEEEQELAMWYDSSPEECQKEIDDIHAIIDMAELISIKSATAPVGAITTEKRGSRKSIGMTAFISLAATVLIAVVSGYMSHKLTYDSLTSQMTSVEAPFGEHFIVTLPDNSTVHLNSGAKLEYPIMFKKDRREVHLTGEALFDVTHDESKPFIVNTFASEVRVLGTKFNVEADQKNNMFSTTLLEGRVKVVNLSDPGRKDFILNPNDVIRIENGVVHLDRITDESDLCWTQGLVKIDGKSFGRLMQDFEEAFGVTINLQMQTLPDISEVKGKIRVNDGIENALRILQRTVPFRFSVNDITNEITIY